MTRIWPFLLLALLASRPAAAAPVPECAGPVEIAKARIVRTERDGVLVMADGRAVRLEGIRLPQPKNDRANGPYAEQALAALAGLANDRELTLTAVAPKEDRYDRIRAQAFSDTDWLQLSLLKRGLARVSISPDRVECAAELYAAEIQARNAHAGLWSLPAYAIRSPDKLGGAAGMFQIVEGKVTAAEQRGGSVVLDFGAGQKNDFTVTISGDDLANFRMIGVDPRGYAGKTVRVRGIVENAVAPRIAIANPLQMEIVQ